MIAKVRHSCRRHGIAAIEFAVVLPFILILLVGIWEVGRMIEVHQIMQNAVREGARKASTGLYTNTEVTQAVKDYVRYAGLNSANVNVDVSPSDVTQTHQFDPIIVNADVPYTDVRWVLLAEFFANGNSKIRGKSIWLSGVDQPTDFPLDPVGY